MKSFKGKTVLITGASSGIGEAFARRLATEGAHLILTARSEQKLQALSQELSRQHGITCGYHAFDLSRPETPALLFEKTRQDGRHVDIVINNAGFGKWGKFHAIDYATYQNMCNLNMNAVVALTHLFLPAMLKQGGGGFINVASTAAFLPVAYFATYSATKAFVLSFTEALWAEYKDEGITFTCLCPGGTDTNFHKVSEMDESKLAGLEPADKVARVGLEAFLKGRPSVISGVKNHLMAGSVRFVPRRVTARIAASVLKP